MERLGEEIGALSMQAYQLDKDAADGKISYKDWLVAAIELLDKKNEVLDILSDVERYGQEVRREMEEERKLRVRQRRKQPFLKQEPQITKINTITCMSWDHITMPWNPYSATLPWADAIG